MNTTSSLKEAIKSIKFDNTSNKKTILFYSHYFEVLKTYLPYIEYFRNNYNVYVAASCLSFSNDEQRCKNLLLENKINGCLWKSDDPIDKFQDNIRAKKKLSGIFWWYILFLWREKQKAREIFNKIRPNVLILGSDKRKMERYLVEEASANNVPSICLQWSMGPILRRAFIENKSETIIGREKSNNKNIWKVIYRILKIPNSILLRVLRLKIPVYAKCFGGGNATVLAAIGEGSKEFYSSMGISPKKIRVVGHALYEDIYIKTMNKKNEKSKEKARIFKLLNIPLNSNYILCCTSYLKPGYYKFLSKDGVYLARERKIKTFLDIDNDLYVVIKLHPREDIAQFSSLTNLSSRVRVLRDVETNQLIPFCSMLLIRNSTTAIYGMMYKKTVISHNYPPLPMGTLYGELGGTIHVNSEEELKEVVSKIFKKEESILRLKKDRRDQFLSKYLNINPDNNYKNDNILPSIINMKKLIEDLTK